MYMINYNILNVLLISDLFTSSFYYFRKLQFDAVSQMLKDHHLNESITPH